MKLQLFLLSLLVAMGVCCSAICADDTGITVTGSGEAKVKPNRLEIDLKASSSAELTSDAVIKYRDALRRAKEAFEKLKIEHLEIADRGLNVANNNPAANSYQAQLMMANGNQPAAKAEVGIAKSLRLSISGLDKLSEEEIVSLVAKLLDTAKDAGVTAGSDSNSAMMARLGMSVPNSMVTFVADDATEARAKASAAAFQEAKKNASRLAGLAGVVLGPVLSMEELNAGSTKGKSLQEQMLSAVYGIGSSEAEDPRLAASALVELPVKVTVRVRFGIQSPGGATK
jgi:uncharacterized protein